MCVSISFAIVLMGYGDVIGSEIDAILSIVYETRAFPLKLRDLLKVNIDVAQLGF